MKYIGACWLIFSISTAVSAETNYGPVLAQALALERAARPEEAVKAIDSLLDSKSLDAADTGKAWNILGLAYRDLGKLTDAKRAFEESLRTLQHIPGNVRDYAVALDNLGGLHRAMGELEAATRIDKQALSLYEKIHDHAGMAISSSNLAGFNLEQHRIHQGKAYVQQAEKEAQLTNDLSADNRAAIFSMEGLLARLEGDPSAATAAYGRALDLWKSAHGEEHPLSGWGFMLVGQAEAESGKLPEAMTMMQHGMAILEKAVGPKNPRYLSAQIAYAGVLDRTGSHAEAISLRDKAEAELHEFFRRQCTDCTVSVAALR